VQKKISSPMLMLLINGVWDISKNYH